MRVSCWPRAIIAACCALTAAAALAATSNQSKELHLPKDLKIPNDAIVAVYMPASDLKFRFYSSAFGVWVEPGKALDSSRSEVGARFFTHVVPIDFKGDGPYGLLLAVNPNWSAEKGQLKLAMKYKVFGADAKQLLDGTQEYSVAMNAGGAGGGFLNAALHAMQLVYLDVLRRLEPNAEKFPATAQLTAIDRTLLADHAKPVSTGTAFYINKSGQMMTAAHVLRDCLVLEAAKDGQKFPVTQHSINELLDLAVVDSGKPTTKALPLRTGEDMMLGEAVTNVGYPLQGLLADSPNLTRGNVSARAGMKGSLGLFQFSAPIQPGASGGPVVSDGGELLGVTVSTLNAAALIKEGLLPQNVNFALEARYAAMFLRNSNIDFVEVPPNAKGDMRTANDAAIGAVVQLSCYQ
jgi:serine protease Do